MRHLGWIGLNVCLLIVVLLVSFMAFGYLVMAEEYGSHPAVTQYSDYNPQKDLVYFCIYTGLSGLLYILLSKYQKGTYISKSLITICIILLQVLFNLYPMTFFVEDDPLTTMRLVTAVISIVVLIFSGHDFRKYYKQAKKYIRRRDKLLLKVSLRRQ